MRYHAFTVIIEKPCCLLLLALSHNYTQIHGQRLYIYMVCSCHRIDWQLRQGTLSALKPIQIQDIKHNRSMPHMNFGQAGFRRKMLWSTTELKIPDELLSSFIAYIDDPINMGGSGVMAMLTFFLTWLHWIPDIGKKCLRKVLH